MREAEASMFLDWSISPMLLTTATRDPQRLNSVPVRVASHEGILLSVDSTSAVGVRDANASLDKADSRNSAIVMG